MRVDQVTTTKQARKNTNSRVEPIRRSELGHYEAEKRESSNSPPAVKLRGVRSNDQKQGGETRSELNFPLTNKKTKHEWEDNKTRLNVAQSFIGRGNINMSRSPLRNRNELGLAGSGVRETNHYEHMTTIGDHRDKLI